MITIRLCLPTEWSTLQKLNDEVFQDNHKYDPDLVKDWALSDAGENYFQRILRDKNSCCFIASADKNPVGYIVGSPKKYSYRKSRYFEIDNMGVSPNYRSKGIGSKLIERLIVWAEENNYDKLIVNAYFSNASAIEFYKKNGFNEIDISMERKIKLD